jgi:hypothetical protein
MIESCRVRLLPEQGMDQPPVRLPPDCLVVETLPKPYAFALGTSAFQWVFYELGISFCQHSIILLILFRTRTTHSLCDRARDIEKEGESRSGMDPYQS